jgi:MinD superfamily P-loop ATPase
MAALVTILALPLVDKAQGVSCSESCSVDGATAIITVTACCTGGPHCSELIIINHNSYTFLLIITVAVTVIGSSSAKPSNPQGSPRLM